MATPLELVLRTVLDFGSFVGERHVLATGVSDGSRFVALLGSVTPGVPVEPDKPFIAGGEHDPKIVVTAALVADRLTKAAVEQPIEPLSLSYPVVQLLPNGGR